jgi:hypothetical protein
MSPTCRLGQRDAVAACARRKSPAIATALHAHVGHIGILAGGRDFAEDEERPIGLDLHRHRRFADVAVAQFGGDLQPGPPGSSAPGTAPISGMVIEPPASIA